MRLPPQIFVFVYVIDVAACCFDGEEGMGGPTRNVRCRTDDGLAKA